MLALSRLHPRHWWNPRLLWDVFMVWVALVNLGLIVFDLTYLLLRPTYFRYAPVVTQAWDPVKGIEPHPLTERLVEEVEAARRLIELDPQAAGLGPRLEGIERLTLLVLETNPFQRSGQERTLEVLKALIAREVGTTTLELESPTEMTGPVHAFWSGPPDTVARRLELFEETVVPLLRINFFREVTLTGRPVDHFWMIDLPFLCLFIAEFGVRWALSVRRREHRRWYFFPIFNWYDLLGLVPYTEFRIFRLFRIASIYMRLRRSEVTRIGQDAISRAVAWVSNIIAEEISDAVALRILREAQDEIRDGTHRRIFDRAIVTRRERIEAVLAAEVRELLLGPAVQEHLKDVVRLHVERAAADPEVLRGVPVPHAVLAPVVRRVGEIALEATLRSMAATLASDEGREAIRELTRAVLDEVLEGPLRDELDALAQEIGIDVIEEMKRAVAVKKWAEGR